MMRGNPIAIYYPTSDAAIYPLIVPLIPHIFRITFLFTVRSP